MWRIATNFDPELPACDAFFFKRQEDFIHRIVAGDCDWKGPYSDYWSMCMKRVKQMRDLAKEDECSVMTSSEARAYVGRSTIPDFLCNRVKEYYKLAYHCKSGNCNPAEIKAY